MMYKIGKAESHCLECGTVTYGRNGQKFCSSKCKNKWWNRKTNARTGYQLKVLNILDRNYRILTRLLSIGVLSVRSEDLLLLGFRPDVMTGHRRILKREWNECFDIGYLQMPSRISNLHYLEVGDAAVREDDPAFSEPASADL